jgi:hypothetical protein
MAKRSKGMGGGDFRNLVAAFFRLRHLRPALSGHRVNTAESQLCGTSTQGFQW